MSITKSKVLVNVRVDADIKKQAEQVTEGLGINLSSAINLFLAQLVREQGMPFRPHLSEVTYADEKELDEKIQAGIMSYVAEETLPYQLYKERHKAFREGLLNEGN
jgi:DNA-damage-inducible protein J